MPQSAKLKRAATPRRTIGLLGTFRVRMGSARAQSVPKRFQKERAGQAADERMNTTRAVSLLRTGGAFLLNFAVATVGVGILESPFIRYVHFFPVSKASILRGDLLTSAVAYGVGYSVYARWESRSAKWVWLAGLGWLGTLVLLMLNGRHGTIWEISGTGTSLDFQNFSNWTEYTLPGLRTMFYSAGAFCSSRRTKHKLLNRLLPFSISPHG
jgi:hypothetical protein